MAAMLEGIARCRRCFLKGENLDLKKASDLLLDDFRSGRLGRLTLERPEELQTSEQKKI